MTHAAQTTSTHSRQPFVRGLIVPTVTAYTAQDTLDIGGIERLARFYAEQQVAGLFPGGTTGEFLLLSPKEREELLTATLRGVQSVAGATTQIIAHTGAATLPEVLRLSRHAAGLGIQAVAVVTPYYYAYGEEEILAFYHRVCRALPELRVYAYTIPQRTGNTLSPAGVGSLMSEPNFAGIKDSSGDMHRLLALTEIPGLSVLAGADDLAGPFISHGGHGLVSGPGGIVPELFQEFFRVLESGDAARTLALTRHIRVFSRIIRGGARIDYMKAGMDWRGLSNGPSRAPLSNMTADERRDLMRELDAFAADLAADGLPLRELVA